MQRARLMGRRQRSSFLTHSQLCSGDVPIAERVSSRAAVPRTTRLGGLLSPSPEIPPKTSPQSLFISAAGSSFEQRFCFSTCGTFLWLNMPKTF